MEVLKNNLEVTTKTKQLEDTATGDKGNTAYKTFLQKDVEETNEYYVPFHAIDHVIVKKTATIEDISDVTCSDGTEPTPAEPTIEGADDVSINQGVGIDLAEGVKAYDGDGNEIPFTVEPETIDKCDVGVHEVTYTADGVSITRTVQIIQIADPVISGLTDITVEVGEEFDPLEGVTAKDGNGNDVDVEVVEEETRDWLYAKADAQSYSVGEYDSSEGYKIEVVSDKQLPMGRKSELRFKGLNMTGSSSCVEESVNFYENEDVAIEAITNNDTAYLLVVEGAPYFKYIESKNELELWSEGCWALEGSWQSAEIWIIEE